MRKNAKLYLLSWALCFMWTKNYCLHKKLKFWMKGPDWKDQKSSSKYNPFMFSLRIIYTLCLMDKKENRLREPTNRLILILEESNRVHDRKPSLIISNGNQNCPTVNCPDSGLSGLLNQDTRDALMELVFSGLKDDFRRKYFHFYIWEISS